MILLRDLTMWAPGRSRPPPYNTTSDQTAVFLKTWEAFRERDLARSSELARSFKADYW
jgi:hypothetical protein